MILNTILSLFGVYVFFCFVLYWKQESFIFYPTQLPLDYSFSAFKNFEEIFFPTKEGQLHALHFMVEKPEGLILYFHGNSEALESWGYEAVDFTNLGFEVLMPDYRGYGKSSGIISEQALYEDAHLWYDFIQKKWPQKDIVLYGRSLGTGIATELATKVHPRLLILETPYTSMPAMANKTIPFVPVKKLMRYQFHNITKIHRVNCPVHIFGATKDSLTPYRHAVALAKKTGSPDEVLTSIEGAGHGNISEFPVFHQKLRQLLKTRSPRC